MLFRGKYFFLSNFYLVPGGIKYKDMTFPTVENAYQAAKTNEDVSAFTYISAAEAKKLGKVIPLRKDWETVKYQIMFDFLKQKFDKIKGYGMLYHKLQDVSGDIVETNTWHDNLWGACVCERCKNKTKHNILGHMLSDIRDNTQTWQNFVP